MLFPGIRLRTELPSDVPRRGMHWDKSEIERYADGIEEIERDIFARAAGDINMLIHDLRSISTSIYNAALRGKMSANKGDFSETVSQIDNIISAQTVLKIRTDIVDYLHNPASVIDIDTLEVVSKTRRVIDAFRPNAQTKNISIITSSDAQNVYLDGPDVFEFIPFVLLENAIKYSPTGGRIRVQIQEEKNQVTFSLRSFGPRIEDDEKKAIFDKGVRGKNAPDGAGSGYGLYVLDSVVQEHFSGAIGVEQDHGQDSFNNSGFHVTTFVVKLPKLPLRPQ